MQSKCNPVTTPRSDSVIPSPGLVRTGSTTPFNDSAMQSQDSCVVSCPTLLRLAYHLGSSIPALQQFFRDTSSTVQTCCTAELPQRYRDFPTEAPNPSRNSYLIAVTSRHYLAAALPRSCKTQRQFHASQQLCSSRSEAWYHNGMAALYNRGSSTPLL
jgi:hypothetical protein